MPTSVRAIACGLILSPDLSLFLLDGHCLQLRMLAGEFVHTGRVERVALLAFCASLVV